MDRLILAFLVLLAPFSLLSDEPANQLRVLCYNIHFGQGTDGKYDVKRLAEVIKAQKPDLVALQEVDVGVKRSGRVHQAQRLGELTEMKVRYGPTQHYQGGLYGNAVLSKLPILDVLIQPLPYTESTEEKVTYPRGCIAVTVQGPDGKPLRFISTHFQHNVHEDRVAEAMRINELFTGESAKIPTILAGDINARPTEEPVTILLKNWSTTLKEVPEPTAPSKNPRSRIDYIFYRIGDPLEMVEHRVIPEEVASDHRPVFAVFTLK